MKINEKNLCIFATTPPYDLEGVLNKKGEGNKLWQKRYFVLKGNLLFYFEKKYDKEPLGLIIVEGCTIELSEDGEPYSFQIVFNGNRSYTLCADNQKNMEIWMKALTSAGYEYRKLMVAELKRQLVQYKQDNTQNLISIEAPKPPPRRQNPFNRPAPLPPTSLNCNDTAESLASDGSSINITNSISTNTSHQHLVHLDSILDDKNDQLSFQKIHEAFGREILKDINERKKQKEEAERPLIIF